MNKVIYIYINAVKNRISGKEHVCLYPHPTDSSPWVFAVRQVDREAYLEKVDLR